MKSKSNLRITVKSQHSKPYTVIKHSTKKDKIGFIVIDPGHGGKDPGAVGYRTREKDITLKMGNLIGRQIKKHIKGIRVVYTRKSDRFVELIKRTKIANRYLKKYGNGIFLSIHVNASLSRRSSGFETYFLSQNPSNDDARSTAALENNVILMESKSKDRFKDIDYVEAIMLTNQIQRESSMLAYAVQNGMKRYNRRFKSRGVKKADFFVLRGALMPAVLVEVGYITNRRERRYLKKAYYQRLIVKGIIFGLKRFIKKYNRMIQKKY